MLDINYIDYLFAELPIEKKRELLKKLFGEAKQSMNYFKKVKDPGLSKLEILADFHDLPIDSLRLDSKLRRMPFTNEEDSIYNAINIIAKRYKEYQEQNPGSNISLKEYVVNDIYRRISTMNLLEEQNGHI